jgi:predicted dehydrogenase
MLNFALVGCGGMANWHAQELKKIPEVSVVALCDTRPEQTKAFREKYFADAKEFADYDLLLSQATELKVDAVVLVTPHTTHYSQAKAALLAGLNVLVEKPMVTSSEHAYDLWATQVKAGRQLGITFQAPYTAEYQYIKEMRDLGRLGKPQIIQGWLAQGWMKGTTNTWRQDPSLSGGGQMYDSGAHVLNAIMWIMNEPVVEVSCIYDNLGCPVDINGVALMRFESGALGSIAIGGNSPGWNVRVSLQTDRCQVITGPHGGFLEISGDPALKYPHVPTDATPWAFTPHHNFVQSLLGKQALQTSPRHGVLLSALMDAIYESGRTRQTVKVKPVPASLG